MWWQRDSDAGGGRHRDEGSRNDRARGGDNLRAERGDIARIERGDNRDGSERGFGGGRRAAEGTGGVRRWLDRRARLDCLAAPRGSGREGVHHEVPEWQD